MVEENSPKQNMENSAEQPEAQHELSKIAKNPKQQIIILTIIVVVVASLLFLGFFINTKNPDSSVNTTEVPTATTSVSNTINEVPPIPQLPELPKLIEPELPPPVIVPEPVAEKPLPPPAEIIISPPLPSAPPSPLSSKLSQTDEEQQRQEAKRKSGIILIAGTPAPKTAEQIEREADFKKRGNMELVLGRGKIIDAILESAINSDLGGEVRAVISRDVFSESGRNILIPKGSRIFGTYDLTADGAYGRIVIAWNSTNLSSGYTVNLQGTGVDSLGRKGTQGRVDNKYKERLSNVIMASVFNIGLAKGLDKMVEPPTTAQTATENTNAANQINAVILSLSSDTTKPASQKITGLCTAVLGAIPDKTSTDYITFNTACTNINITSPTATNEQKFISLATNASTVATSLATNSATAYTPTQAQQASQTAFTDITDTVKEMVHQQNLSPTITINQGTEVKIYVNKDYQFPPAALNKSGLIR